jgi:hypothetical protein
MSKIFRVKGIHCDFISSSVSILNVIFVLKIFCSLKNCRHDGEITLGYTYDRERDLKINQI